MKIIERIRNTMEEKDIKQIELAKAVGVGKSTINAWFINNSDPKAEQLPPIAELLGTSLDYLITGKDQKQPQRLTIDEQHLIKNYRKVSDKGKGRIQENAREMVTLYPEITVASVRPQKASSGPIYNKELKAVLFSKEDLMRIQKDANKAKQQKALNALCQPIPKTVQQSIKRGKP